MTTATPITEAFAATLRADFDAWRRAQPDGYDAWGAVLWATERAAVLCDELVYALDNGGNRYRREADASKCAAAIRASGGMGAE